MKPQFIEATTLPDAWHQAIYRAIDHGQEFTIDEGSNAGQKRLELDFVTVHVKNPGMGELLPHLNPLLGLPDPVAPGYLEDYMPKLMTDTMAPGEAYTYGERLTAGNAQDALGTFPEFRKPVVGLPKGVLTYLPGLSVAWVDQIALMIHTYKTSGYRNNQMILQVGQPGDMLLRDPPCLRHIDTRIQDGALHFFPYFRSWDLWSGLPANLAAIETLKQYCAGEIGVDNGEILASSKGLHLYDYVFELAEAVRGGKL